MSPTGRMCGRPSTRRSASSGCRCQFARITDRRSPQSATAGCRSLRCGGSSSASNRSGSNRASRSRTAASSACTARSRRKRPILRRRRSPSGGAASTTSAPSITTSVRTRPWISPRRLRSIAAPIAPIRALCASPTIRTGPPCARVRSNGVIKWAGDLVFVSETLIGEPVAVEETEEGEWLVRYAHVELGFIDPSGRCAGANCRSLGAPVDLWTTRMHCPQGPQDPKTTATTGHVSGQKCQPCIRSKVSTIIPGCTVRGRAGPPPFA